MDEMNLLGKVYRKSITKITFRTNCSKVFKINADIRYEW